VLPCAEPLLDATGAERRTHRSSDERARLTLFEQQAEPGRRMLDEMGFGQLRPHPATAPTAAGDDTAEGNGRDTAAQLAEELVQYQALLASRSLRFGKRVAAMLGYRVPPFQCEPGSIDEVRRARFSVLSSPAWDAGAPLRLASRLLKLVRRKRQGR
jgi:hypothetical protein